jgi:hypothetical protein
MAIYERQYTNRVNWQNSPSVATPLDAEKLNIMDKGLQDIDAAAKNAIDQLVEMIDGGGGMDTIKNVFFVTSCVNSNMTEIGGGNGNGDDEQYAS